MFKNVLERMKDTALLYAFTLVAFWPEIAVVIAASAFAGVAVWTGAGR